MIKRAKTGDLKALKECRQIRPVLDARATHDGDAEAARRRQVVDDILRQWEDDNFADLVKRANDGDMEAVAMLREMRPNLDDRSRGGEAEAVKRLKIVDEILKKHPEDGAIGAAIDDNQSDLSLMMVKSQALKNFGKNAEDVALEVPPTAESRRFNECDVIGNLERDEKGNVIPQEAGDNEFKDKDGFLTNNRGYLIDPKTGHVINNLNNEMMFDGADIDEKGELPAPFNVEKHNFNPHEVRGDFEYDRNGKARVDQNPEQRGAFVDKRGSHVSNRGYRLDEQGNLIDNHNRKKFDAAHMQDGDLPKLFNYNGRRFDITDTIGQCDKDANGNIIPQTDKDGDYIDNLSRKINSRGYLIDKFGNVVDKDGREIFEGKHLTNDEIPKIFPFTKFNVKNVLGKFEMDPLGNPILDRDAEGSFIDQDGKRCNSKGYMIDSEGNVINKNGKRMFDKKLLDNENDIPKVFRTGLLKSDTASSLSRLMSEIGKNQPSEFDAEEQRIQDELAANMRQKRGNSGNTSVDSMMEDTPANYNNQNQRFDPNEDADAA